MVEERDKISVGISPERLDESEAMRFVVDPHAGGVCVFAGVTRARSGDRQTIELSYETYDEMAVTTLRQIAREVLEAHEVGKIYTWHRTGTVPAGEASVLIAVSAPHRAAAFDGCRYIIDELKIRAPIWKKEHLTDGRSFWVEGDQSGPS